MPETVTTFCRICEALGGLRVTREHGKVTAIEPDPEPVATEGFAGVKGLKQLTQPFPDVDRPLAPDSWSGIAPD